MRQHGGGPPAPYKTGAADRHPPGLRKSKGKIFAEIYDFVTLPRSLEAARTGMIDKDNDLGLVRRELARVIDFANLSSNPSYSNEIINSIYDAFDIDVIQGEVNIYE